MNILIRISFLLIIYALFSACCPLTSINPLSSTDEIKFDDRLIGIWQLQYDSDIVYLHIGKEEGNKTKVLSIEYKRDGNLEIIEASMLPTIINGNNFMNLDTMTIKPTSEKALSEKGYILIKYDFKNKDTFSFTILDEEVIKAAIKGKKLKGIIENQPEEKNEKDSLKIKNITCIQITDSTEKLVQFIKESNINNLFPEKDSIRFNRVK